MNEDLHVPVIHDVARQQFELRTAEGLATVTYRHEGEFVVIDHTWVPPQARGQGVAAAVVRAVLDEAERLGWAIVPRCPYVASYIDRNPEFKHLLGHSQAR